MVTRPDDLIPEGIPPFAAKSSMLNTWLRPGVELTHGAWLSLSQMERVFHPHSVPYLRWDVNF